MENWKNLNFEFEPNQIENIENQLETIGYVRIQFKRDDLPIDGDFVKNAENFFVNFVEKLGGFCVEHNKERDSFVWHVKPVEQINGERKEVLPRSQTDEEFEFHTDSSYDVEPAEFFGLFVIEQDQFGGGIFQIISLSDILEILSEKSRNYLENVDVEIKIPQEFRRNEKLEKIRGKILFGKDKIRFREDLISSSENEPIAELRSIIDQVDRFEPKLTQLTMILLNNRKFLHARSKIIDPRRHLLRIRFNRPFNSNFCSIYGRNKFEKEFFYFSNEFDQFLENKIKTLSKILSSIVFHYDKETSIGETIRNHFQFEPKIEKILRNLNFHRTNYRIGAFRPDLIFSRGNSFRLNGKHWFQPKICEINGRFCFNGFFLSSQCYSIDRKNVLFDKFSRFNEEILDLSNFDRTKPMFIIKQKEKGFDIHLFKDFWTKFSGQNCFFVEPNRLKIVQGKLIDEKEKLPVDQFVLELHQNEILELPEQILEYFIENKNIRYINDLRTIFIVHDKRIFGLISNEDFVRVILNDRSISLNDFVPKTFILGKLKPFIRDSILNNRQNWCLKPNGEGKGKDVAMGVDLTFDDWKNKVQDEKHRHWIVQEYHQGVQFKSNYLSGTCICFNEKFYRLGIIRLSTSKIVNISNNGRFARCFIDRQGKYSSQHQTTLTKDELDQQLTERRLNDEFWNRKVYFSSSGGTHGKSLYFPTDIQENRTQRKILVELMIEENILCEDDVCLNLFHSGNVYRSMEIFNDFCSMINCTSIPVGSSLQDEKVLEFIEYFRPTVLLGTPHRLTQLGLFIEKNSTKNIRFSKIIYAGEPLDSNRENFLKKIFVCSVILGFYGSAETGVFACQSAEFNSTKMYLYPKKLVDLEIEQGNLIVTNLVRKRNQLIRFNMGDQAKIIDSSSNDRFGLIELISTNRLFFIGSFDLKMSNIEDSLDQTDIIEWQLILKQIEKKKNLLLFRLFLNENGSIKKIEEHFRFCLDQIFHGNLSKISDQLEFKFESVSIDNFIRSSTSDKFLRFVDQRMD